MGLKKKPKPPKGKTKSRKTTSLKLTWSLNKTQLVVLLIVLVTISFIIRVLNSGVISLWVDEYVHVMRAKDVLNGTGPLFTDDNNGILYTIAMLPFNFLFGISQFWSRFPSVLFGSAAVFLTYFLGKRLVNSYVGFLSAFFMAFSLYQIYWSRLARNYAIFVCMFLILLIVFWSWYENNKSEESNSGKRMFLSPVKSGLLFGALILSLFSHQLTFFFLFGFGTYNVLMLLGELIKNKKFNLRSKYFIIGLPSLVFFILVFTPFIAPFIQNVLSLILPERVATWVIPNWARLEDLYASKPFEVFDLYHKVFLYDTNYLYLLAIPGIFWGFFRFGKVAVFLFSFLIIPFLLMSFVFREPSLPRYLIYLEPLLFISISLFLYISLRFFQALTINKANYVTHWLSILPFLIAILPIKAESVLDLVLARKKNSYLVDTRLSKWSFTNWSDPCKYVKSKMKENDVMMSTIPGAVDYYLGIENTLKFRQRSYATEKKTYIMNEYEKTSGPSASTFENLRKTLQDYPRGWLIVDYYFNNITVDEKVRNFVYKNMYHHPDATVFGDVMVFSWDENSRNLSHQNVVVDLGRSPSKNASRKFNVNLSEQAVNRDMKLQLNALWIDDPKEGAVEINGHWYFLQPTPSERIESFLLDISEEHLKTGNNEIRFSYNPNCTGDTRRGYIIYFMGFRAT